MFDRRRRTVPPAFLGLSLDAAVTVWLISGASSCAPWVIARLRDDVEPARALAAAVAVLRGQDGEGGESGRAQ